MNRRDFVLTALGVSGTVAAGGAYALDINSNARDGAAEPQETDGTAAAQRSPTETATDAGTGTPTDTESATDTPTETETTTQRDTPTETDDDDDGWFGGGDGGDDETETSTPTETETSTQTETETSTQTETETSTQTETRTQTPTENPRDGIEVEAETQSDDGKRVLVRLRNTNDYSVYVESTVTWTFEEGDDDSQTRSGPIGPSGTEERQYFTVREGTVAEIEVTLPTVERV